LKIRTYLGSYKNEQFMIHSLCIRLTQVAMLAKQCVDEDPILRPDMKQIVITLSQILLSSVEWEATLAGNSQVFSGLVQGR